jgi:hypothetical protein
LIAADGRTSLAGRLRRWLLLVVVLGTLGLVAELLLLDHVETFAQWLPLAVLVAGLAASLAVMVRPEPVSVRIFQLSMLAFVATGATGVFLHYRSNVEFELEMNPTLRGWALVWRSLEGGVPALAPGALTQLGLVGLVFTVGHPGLRRSGWDGRSADRTEEERSE